MQLTPTWPRRQARPRARGLMATVAIIAATVVLSAGTVSADPFTIYEQQNASGHMLTTRNAECMWGHIHIAKPQPGTNAYRPYISFRATMDYAMRSWAPSLGWYDKQCFETGHRAAPWTMHIAEHLAVWAQWINNNQGAAVWCNNGPELTNGDWQHEISTSWWWWRYPCMDISGGSSWFYSMGYYRADMSIGTHERRIQTPWLNAV